MINMQIGMPIHYVFSRHTDLCTKSGLCVRVSAYCREELYLTVKALTSQWILYVAH